jgi:hypothetical protein
MTTDGALPEEAVCRAVDCLYGWFIANDLQWIAQCDPGRRWPPVESFVLTTAVPEDPVAATVLDLLRTAYYARCIVLDPVFAARTPKLLDAVGRARAALSEVQNLIGEDVARGLATGQRGRKVGAEAELLRAARAPGEELERLDARLRALRPDRLVPRTLSEWESFVQQGRVRLSEAGMPCPPRTVRCRSS